MGSRGRGRGVGRVRRASISNVPGLLKVTVEPAAAVAPIFNVMILVKTARSSSISGADPADMTPLSHHLEEDFFKEELWVPSEASKGGLRNEKKGGDQRQTVLELDYVRIT